ncbi:hypothetical protein IFM89_014561 [Coptis chinensis]|uniref:X8 domain-containing protein n=1 Tax=Coptis chinensis TaxID=261450 RepID=A0A835LBU4_9MAGN|nr:hypothetical protein IFM89_014561 [Coptis chinensis]
MGITHFTSLYIFIFILATTPLHYFTLASSETNIKASDDGSSGVQKVWCVAKNNADDVTLQQAIEWACGHGGTDCGPIQSTGPCYDPNNFQSTASYAFNDYYTKNGRTEESCNFGGAAALSDIDPSHDNCKFLYSTNNVVNGSIVANGPSRDDTSGGEITGWWARASVTTVSFLIAALVL